MQQTQISAAEPDQPNMELDLDTALAAFAARDRAMDGRFVVGVKTGSGSFEPSSSPSGSTTPHTAPVARYSSSPPPVR